MFLFPSFVLLALLSFLLEKLHEPRVWWLVLTLDFFTRFNGVIYTLDAVPLWL